MLTPRACVPLERLVPGMERRLRALFECRGGWLSCGRSTSRPRSRWPTSSRRRRIFSNRRRGRGEDARGGGRAGGRSDQRGHDEEPPPPRNPRPLNPNSQPSSPRAGSPAPTRDEIKALQEENKRLKEEKVQWQQANKAAAENDRLKAAVAKEEEKAVEREEAKKADEKAKQEATEEEAKVNKQAADEKAAVDDKANERQQELELIKQARLEKEEEKARADAARKAEAARRIAEARKEAEARRKERMRKLKKLKGAVHSLVAAHHVAAAAAATRYAVIGVGEAAVDLCTAICASKNAPVGVISLATALESAESAHALGYDDPMRPAKDSAVEIVKKHGRLIREVATRQEAVDNAGIILVGLPANGAEEALRGLTFTPEQCIVCLQPTLSLQTLHDACQPVPPLNIVKALLYRASRAWCLLQPSRAAQRSSVSLTRRQRMSRWMMSTRRAVRTRSVWTIVGIHKPHGIGARSRRICAVGTNNPRRSRFGSVRSTRQRRWRTRLLRRLMS